MNKYIKGVAVAGAVALSQGVMAGCGEITMAEMNWASAELMANVDKIILEEGYGCDVELVPGATMTTFASMNEKGQPQVAPELWANAVVAPLSEAVAEGRMHVVNGAPIVGAGEGWFVPDYMQEKHPQLKTVMDSIEHPQLFPDAEDPSKGALIGCPAGWGCQLATASLFRAFDMEAKGWVLVDPGSAAGLDGSIAKAVERGENWIGYYWSPTALAGRYGLVPIDFGVAWGGSDNWDNCIVKPEQECADPQPSSWTKSEVNTVLTDDFKANAGAMDYFSNRTFPSAAMNGMLVYMADNQASGEDAAIEFLKQHEAVWSEWVSADTAAKIKNSL
jgi:glycine betaine/proline transport system substrate-binding protein